MRPGCTALCRAVALATALTACHREGAGPAEPEPRDTPPAAATGKAPLTNDPAVSGALDAAGGTTSTGLPPAPTTDAPSSAPPAPAESLRERTPLSDEQIASVSMAVHGAEIEQAKLARAKAKHPKVREFAQLMITEHEQARRDQEKLNAKLQLKPAESPLSTDLGAEAAGTLLTLKKATAKDFDAVYLTSQVNGHRKVLEALDRELTADAKDVGLRKYLQDLRARVQAHLDHAVQLQQAVAPVTAGSDAKAGAAGAAAGAGSK